VFIRFYCVDSILKPNEHCKNADISSEAGLQFLQVVSGNVVHIAMLNFPLMLYAAFVHDAFTLRGITQCHLLIDEVH